MAATFPRGAAKALATVTTPSKGIYLLSMANLPDNRLTPDYIKHALLPALTHIEVDFRRTWANAKNPEDKAAALVLTGERDKGKFFSNGLQLELVKPGDGFFKDVYYKLLARLLTFPMITVSAINGHCFAGGFCLALCTDKRVMRGERAWLCMNELEFGAPLPVGMAAVLKQRLSPKNLALTMLTAKRWTADESLKESIVDEVVPGDSEATIARALEVAQAHAKFATSGVVGQMKSTLYADVLEGLRFDDNLPKTTLGEQNQLQLDELAKAITMAKL